MLVETAQERNEPIFPALIYSCESRRVPGLSQGPAGSRPRLWGWEQFPETHVETSSAGTMWAGQRRRSSTSGLMAALLGKGVRFLSVHCLFQRP